MYEKVMVAIEVLDPEEKFVLYTTFYKSNGKLLLLGIHLAYSHSYTTPSSQVFNYFRSVLRKFGNNQLQTIPPNDFFTIEQRTVEGETYKSLLCKFLKYNRVYIDVVQAHALTQAIDSILYRFDLTSRHIFNGRIFSQSTHSDRPFYQFTEPKESDSEPLWLNLPDEMIYFLRKIPTLEMDQ
jgi:hypothetical protein